MRLMIVILLFSQVVFPQLRVLQSTSSKYFNIKFEKSIPKDELRNIISSSEKIYERYRSKFGFGFLEKKTLFILATAARMKYESGSKVFEDGDYKNDKLYVVSFDEREKRENIDNVLCKIISRALLDQIPACPPWFAEAYSLMAGNDVEKFGRPVQLNISTLADLGEDYARTLDKKGLRDLYAKLGSTIQFLLERFGEQKVDATIKRFREGKTIEETFPAVFNESMREIEKAWILDLKNPVRE
ncbi:MAG: hypothetical protein HZB59_00205 [Ignavibacteriales bacterium]|nr:hypothetical protein [Ignavibacteriales bacterium]